ncbi:MAG: exopolyphosphatase [Bacteroidetes bacterium]|nr:exopolyphosphatase [Bacteroidota bacterium]
MATEQNHARRIAAIDVGTNTVMCLVADVLPDGSLEVLTDEERFARLGEGVDETGRLSEASMDRVVARLAECKTTAERFDAETIVIGATSASRDATNTEELIRRVNDELGLDYRVLSGEEEAELSFRGALALVPGTSEARVLDVGGGSTEIVVGEDGAIRFRTSMDVGSVRLTEQFFLSTPPSAVQIRRAERALDAVLGMISRDSLAGLPLIEGGGTARVLASLIGAGEPAPTIPRRVVREWRDRLLTMSPDKVRALNPDMLGGREDIAGATLLILDAVMQRFGFEAFIAGQGGLRHGLALLNGER